MDTNQFPPDINVRLRSSHQWQDYCYLNKDVLQDTPVWVVTQDNVTFATGNFLKNTDGMKGVYNNIVDNNPDNVVVDTINGKVYYNIPQ